MPNSLESMVVCDFSSPVGVYIPFSISGLLKSRQGEMIMGVVGKL
jgi:hypothetical protein